jgi:secondary thiamine-phosphate synthase enzyme
VSGSYRDGVEGPDDMPGHIKTMLTDVSLTIPVAGGRMALGTYQGVFLLEHRAAGRRRTVALTYLGACPPGRLSPPGGYPRPTSCARS